MEALAGNLLQNEERSCHWSCSVKIVFLKTIVLETLFNKVAGFQACRFIKKRPETTLFLRNLRNF